MSYKEIMNLPEPEGTHVAIACKVVGFGLSSTVENPNRLYFLTRGSYRCWLARMSANQEHWLPSYVVPDYSYIETDKRARWHMAEGQGYIGHFEDWDAVKRFLVNMKATAIQIESE